MNQLKDLQGFIGKTIKSIDDSACNCITITFTDGTSVLLEAESVYPSIGLIGIAAYSSNNS